MPDHNYRPKRLELHHQSCCIASQRLPVTVTDAMAKADAVDLYPLSILLAASAVACTYRGSSSRFHCRLTGVFCPGDYTRTAADASACSAYVPAVALFPVVISSVRALTLAVAVAAAPLPTSMSPCCPHSALASDAELAAAAAARAVLS